MRTMILKASWIFPALTFWIYLFLAIVCIRTDVFAKKAARIKEELYIRLLFLDSNLATFWGSEGHIHLKTALLAQIFEHPEVWGPNAQRVLRKMKTKNASNIDRVNVRRIISKATKNVLEALEVGRQEKILLAGRIQSGKTFSMETMTGLFIDQIRRKGEKSLCVVISENIDDQSDQTLKRFQNHLGAGNKHLKVVDGKTISHDEMVDVIRSNDHVIILTTKNAEQLKKFQSVYTGHIADDIKTRPTLILCDEADKAIMNVSRNGKDTVTYDLMKDTLDFFVRSSLVMFTATPFAILGLKSRDALAPTKADLLPYGENYTGLDQVLEKEVFVKVKQFNKDEPMDADLRKATNNFVVVEACRRLKKIGKEGTMLVIPSTRNPHQASVYEKIHGQIGNLCRMSENTEKMLEKIFQEIQNPELVSGLKFNSVLVEIKQVLHELKDKETLLLVNSKKGNDKLPDWENTSNKSFILVGGFILARGVTIPGLWCTYMNRGQGAGNADTLLQLMRPLGYRQDILPFMKIYMSETLLEIMHDIRDHFRDAENGILEHRDEIQKWIVQAVKGKLKRPHRFLTNGGSWESTKCPTWIKHTHPMSYKVSAETQRNHRDAFIEKLGNGKRVTYANANSNNKNNPGTNHTTHKKWTTTLDKVMSLLEGHGLWKNADAKNIKNAVVFLNQLPKDTEVDVYLMSEGRPRCRTYSNNYFISPHQGYSSNYDGDGSFHSKDRITLQIHNIDFTQEKGSHQADDSKVIPYYTLMLAEDMMESKFQCDKHTAEDWIKFALETGSKTVDEIHDTDGCRKYDKSSISDALSRNKTLFEKDENGKWNLAS